MIEPGRKAPDFKLPDQDGNVVKLSTLRGAPVVVYFYPKAGTPGCTTQACGVRDREADYAATGARVLGVSPDAVAKVKKFHDEQKLNFTLLADPDHTVAERYGVWVEKSMYSNRYMGVERTTFVIDPAGKVIEVLRKVIAEAARRAGAGGARRGGARVRTDETAFTLLSRGRLSEGRIDSAYVTDLPLTLTGFEERAAEVLDEGPLGYYAGGAGDEVTLRDNVEAWRRIAVRPRVMVDVSTVDPKVTVLGRERPHPIFVAPTAFHRLATPEGERATARAAAAADSLYCLSSLATTSVAQAAEAAPGGARWFQLYVFKDRAVSDELLAAAVEHGYEAVVLTVDLPVLGIRERDMHSGFAIQEATAIPSVERTEPLSMLEVGELIDASLTWTDVERFAGQCGLPVIVKGVLTAEDAVLAAEHGAAGVVVSNHGGRQLDTVLAGADALPEVVDAAGDRIEVLVDGGIRRGSDVLKALALGARAVLVGRPVLWGLACGGEEGARRVLSMLRLEFDNALALAGVPRAADLDGSSVQRAPWAAA